MNARRRPFPWRDLWLFFWRRNSNNAAVLAIGLTNYLSAHRKRELGEYFLACAQAEERR